MRKLLNVVLARNIKIRTFYTGKRLSSYFKTKEKIKFDHKHYVIYHIKCPKESCTDDYFDESGERVIESVKCCKWRDRSSHMLRHSSCREELY